MKGGAPAGIRLLCRLYLVAAVLYLISLYLFYSRIFILGQEAGSFNSALIRMVFLFMPAYLYFRLSRLRRDAWLCAICFHAFFIINNISAFLEYGGYSHSLVHITGRYASLVYSPRQLFLLILNMLMNIVILSYLFKIRGEIWKIR